MPAIDLPTLRDRLGDDPELEGLVLGGFIAQVGVLRQAMAGAGTEALRTTAHTLKGMALTVEARTLAEAAQRVEAAARAGGPLGEALAALMAAADAAVTEARVLTAR